VPDDYVMAAIPKAMANQTSNSELQVMLDKIRDDRAAGKRDPAAGIIGGN